MTHLGSLCTCIVWMSTALLMVHPHDTETFRRKAESPVNPTIQLHYAQAPAVVQEFVSRALRSYPGIFTATRMPELFSKYPQLPSALRSEKGLTELVSLHPQLYDDVARAFSRAAPDLTQRLTNEMGAIDFGAELLEASLKDEGRSSARNIVDGVYQRALRRLEADGVGPNHPQLEGRLEEAIRREERRFTPPSGKPSWTVELRDGRLHVSGSVGLLFRWEASVSLKTLYQAAAAGVSSIGVLVFTDEDEIEITGDPDIAPPPGGPSGYDDHHVIDAAVARGISDRQPQDTGSVFSSTVGTIYFWTRIGRDARRGDRATQVHHLWYHEGDLISRVVLDVRSSSWRTWSRVSLTPEDVGAWAVEVTDPRGRVIERLEFVIVES